MPPGRRYNRFMASPERAVLGFDWPLAAIMDFCRRWKIAELSVFGSVLRDDFRPGSDLDLLARFAPEARWSLFDHARMERELSYLLGRDVDLVSRAALEQSANWIRRNEILRTARTLHRA
jgi:uncharacterized protein